MSTNKTEFQGRAEIEAAAHEEMMEYLKDKPRYMMEFYYTFRHKTYTTAQKYIIYVNRFINDMTKEGIIEPDDPFSFSNIRPATIDKYLWGLEGKTSCKRVCYFALKFFFKFLKNNQYVPMNIMTDIEAPKASPDEDPEIVVLTKEEIEQIFYNIDHPGGGQRARTRRLVFRKMYRAFMSLALITGLRQSSLREINVQDIDWENLCVTVIQKGGRKHVAYFNELTSSRIQEWLVDREKILKEKGGETDALFINSLCRRMSTANVVDMMDNITWNLDKHITAHKFRSTCCTMILEETGDLSLASHVLGHRNIENTMRYRKFTESSNEKAINAVSKLLQ